MVNPVTFKRTPITQQISVFSHLAWDDTMQLNTYRDSLSDKMFKILK